MEKTHVKWKTESQPQPAVTWTELVLAVDTMGITDLQLHPIVSRVQRNKMIIDYLWILLLNCFHMGMNLGFFGLPTVVELNNNQMPQTSRVIRGETQKRFMFGTPGLLQFSGLL